VPSQLPGNSLLSPLSRMGQFCELHGSRDWTESVPAYMWRSGGWKLVQPIPAAPGDGPECEPSVQGELYHLDSDPLEMRNLYSDPEHHARHAKMTRELLQHLAAAWTKHPLWSA
jgi:arylsulfatase A-like enzyme